MHEHERRLEALRAGSASAQTAQEARAAARRRRRRSRRPRRARSAVARGAGQSAFRAADGPRRPAGGRRGERIGIVGPNGAGKTTLLRTIAGELAAARRFPDAGHGVQSATSRRSAQAPMPGATVLDALPTAAVVDLGPARAYLARFLFRGEDVFKPVEKLSGGERSRLELALVGVRPANLLLLDEPTNHLDIPAREALETFLRETPVTVVVFARPAAAGDGVHGAVGRRGRRQRAAGRSHALPAATGEWRAAVAEGWTVSERARSRDTPIHPPARRSRLDRQHHAGEPTARKPSQPQGRARVLSKDAYATTQAARGGRPDPPWPAQEPARARPRRSRRAGEFRRAATRDKRARRRGCRPRAGRGCVADARRAGATMTAHRRLAARRCSRPLIGLTGPIGCGKSTVASMLADLGGTVIDADELAREVTAPEQPDAARDPRALWRRRLPCRREPGSSCAGADRVRRRSGAARSGAHHPSARAAPVEEAWQRRQRPAPFVVIEAIKLVEGGLAERCDEVWLVDCDPRRSAAACWPWRPDADRARCSPGRRPGGRLEIQLRPRAVRTVSHGRLARGGPGAYRGGPGGG